MHRVTGAMAVAAVVLLLFGLCQSSLAYEAYPDIDCDSIPELYKPVEDDLKPWRDRGGIKDSNRELVEHVCYKQGSRTYYMCVLITDGKVYVTSAPYRVRSRAHTAEMFFGFLIELYDASKRWKLPDAQFALYVADPPTFELSRYGGGTEIPVVLAYSKAPGYAEILIPFSAHYRCGPNAFDDLWQTRNELSTQPPWSQRQPIALGRYSHFCPPPQFAPVLQSGITAPCARTQVAKLAYEHNQKGLLDVFTNNAPCSGLCKSMPIDQHSHYKYLISTDGFSASSKFEKYMLLRSTMLKSGSDLYAHYYHLLRPGLHYEPFLDKGGRADDVLDVVERLRADDTRAQRMGEEAYAFATKYLHRGARMCYWRKVVEGLGALMQYKTSCEEHESCRPLEEELRYMYGIHEGVRAKCLGGELFNESSIGGHGLHGHLHHAGLHGGHGHARPHRQRHQRRSLIADRLSSSERNPRST